MPLRYEIRADAIWIVTQGDVDYEAGLETLDRAITAASEYAPERRWDIVFDICESQEDRSAMELRSIAEIVARHPSVLSGRCAVLAGDDFHFALGRQFGAYSEGLGVDVRVLRNPEAVRNWLQTKPSP
jgi:hypothetical protein